MLKSVTFLEEEYSHMVALSYNLTNTCTHTHTLSQHYLLTTWHDITVIQFTATIHMLKISRALAGLWCLTHTHQNCLCNLRGTWSTPCMSGVWSHMQHPGPAMEIIYHKQPKMLIVFCEQTAKQWVIQSTDLFTLKYRRRLRVYLKFILVFLWKVRVLFFIYFQFDLVLSQ